MIISIEYSEKYLLLTSNNSQLLINVVKFKKCTSLYCRLPAGSYHIDPKTEYEAAYGLATDCDEEFPSCPESILT